MKKLHPKASPSNSNATAFPRVDRVHQLLGRDVILIAWPLGKKATNKCWGNLRVEDTRTLTYRQELEEGNIGVALGAKSGGLCSIDLDSDLAAEEFLSHNPKLRDTLRTRAARGCNVWIYCTDKYPRTRKIKANAPSALDSSVGEWRSEGAQTIVSGRHPSGCDYTFLVEAQPITVSFEEIIWPPGWSVPCERADKVGSVVHRDTDTQKHSHAETHVVSGCCLFDVSAFVPTGREQSDDLIFLMARRNKRWQREAGRKSTYAERQMIIRAWWEKAQEYVDPKMDYYVFEAKFMNACDKAQFADDESPLSMAWVAATSKTLPAEATIERPIPLSPKMRLLIALCYQLQIINGNSPFYLTCRKAGVLLGVPHTTAFCWLENLANPESEFQVLKKTKSGGLEERTANEYLYLPLVTHPTTSERF